MMSPLVVLCMLLVYCHALAHGGDSMDEPNVFETYAAGKLNKLIEKVRTIMKTGNSSMHIPVLDPFSAKQLPLQLNLPELLEMDVMLDDALANGLSTFEITQGDFAVLGMKIDLGLQWSKITASTRYSGKGKLADTVNFFGTGNIDAEVNGLVIGAHVKLTVHEKKLQVKTMETSVSLEKLDLKITGLFDDEEFSELVSKILSDTVPDLISDLQKELTEIANEKVSEFLNGFLKKMTIKDLLALIQ